MKNILFICIILAGSISFAGGSTTGAGPGKEIDGRSIEIFSRNSDSLSSQNLEENLPSTQVYYMRKKLSEVQFATTSENNGVVDIHSLRPEEIQDQSIIEGLKRSRQSKQWERLAIPADVDQTFNSDKFSSEMKSLKNMNKMKIGH